MADQEQSLLSKSIDNMSKAIVTPLDLRLALMDYKERNIPLYIEHLTDEMLWKCIDWAVANFNETQPVLSTKYDVSNFPKRKLLLDSATVEALRLTSLIELRGEMQYSDGGVQSAIYYKSNQFTALRQELEQKVAQEVAQTKRSLNVSSCYGYLC